MKGHCARPWCATAQARPRAVISPTRPRSQLKTVWAIPHIVPHMSFDLGTHIRQLREELGWTQEDLAKRANIDQGDLSRLERGGIDPRWSTVNRIINALGETFSLTTAPTTRRSPLTAETRGSPTNNAVGCGEASSARRGNRSHQAVTFVRPALRADQRTCWSATFTATRSKKVASNVPPTQPSR